MTVRLHSTSIRTRAFSTRGIVEAYWLQPLLAAVIALAGLVSGSHLWQSISFVAVGMLMIPVALTARRLNGLTTRMVVCLAAMTVCNTFADLMRTLSEGHARAMAWSELIGLIGVLMVIAIVARVARSRRSRDFWAVLADGGIVALGVWLLAWVTVVRPTIDRGSMSPTVTVLRSAYPPLGAILWFLLVIIVFSDRARTPAVLATSGAVLAALFGGFSRGLKASGHFGGHLNVSTAAATIATGFVFAALLHPSVRTLIEPTPDGPPNPVVGRFAATAIALVVPIMVMAAVTPKDTTDRIVRTISVGVLAMLVAARTLQAVRANRVAQSALMHSARTDPLTALPNRTLLLEQINGALHDSWTTDRLPTLFFIDLDRFKNINDSLGHAAGDRVLCIVADRLRLAAPPGAIVARIAGDEFVVLDPASCSIADAMAVAETLLARLREPIPLAAPIGDVFATTSIGVARADAHTRRTAQVLLGQADTAMYQAKDAGRNCVALFDEAMHERVTQRLSLESALDRALDRDELNLHYQPIMETSSGEVTGFEALMRWTQADGTMVSPVDFIPIAEETGAIDKMGAWALLEALTQLRAWIDEGVCSPTANMSVNVSPRQLADPNLPTIVGEALLRAGVPPNQLWLEVTEGIMIAEPEIALGTLRRLRSLGVRVAIDDFGTGYSSLSSLQRFPLQRIKIDRAFVQGVADNVNDRALVRTIIAMGASLGLDMVAEGVETTDQLRVLQELGCTKVQGYLISRPIAADAMRATIAALEHRASPTDAQRSSASEFTSSKGNRSSV
ncbi:MAG: hypothetical protein JWM34_2933 [Ilumatobacteraceae bacterium]|nr:hypothetical protein [Ilumatobacteraceae bacterium]